MQANQDEYGDSWRGASPEYLYWRFEEEFYEFRQAVESGADRDEAIEELADIVNFGLMFLERVRAEAGITPRGDD